MPTTTLRPGTIGPTTDVPGIEIVPVRALRPGTIAPTTVVPGPRTLYTHRPDMIRINCDTSYGWVTIDGQPMMCASWCLTDLSPLWGTPDERGTDKLLPGTPGVKPNRRRATVTAYSLNFVVTGFVDQFGSPHANPYVGLETNMEYLTTYVLAPTNVGDGTRELAWHRLSGTTVTVDCHVIGYKPKLGPGPFAVGDLELSIPGGDLHL